MVPPILLNRISVHLVILAGIAGCAGTGPYSRQTTPPIVSRAEEQHAGTAPLDTITTAPTRSEDRLVSLASHQELPSPGSPQDQADAQESTANGVTEQETAGTTGTEIPAGLDPLDELVARAIQCNPRLQRLELDIYEARSRIPQVTALPDPTTGVNGFVEPIETAAGSQRANLRLSQRFPSFKRLDAQGQQIAFEALALEKAWQTEQLDVAADVKAAYYQLYVLGQQIRLYEEIREIFEEQLTFLQARLEAPSLQPQGGRPAVTAGDVTLVTLEISRLSEQLITARQELASTQATLNRLLDRPAETPLPIPEQLDAAPPDWTLAALRELTFRNQPAIEAARLRLQATDWGIEIAALERIPDVTVNFNYFFMDDNRPPSRIVDVGEDAWSLGAAINIPLWNEKYDAREAEATYRHREAQARLREVIRQYDALLADLLEQVQSAAERVNLYENTILPQAHLALETDLQSFSVGQIDIERVLDDIRRLLNLELSYHRALSDLATAQARLEQATGTPLTTISESPAELPLPPEPMAEPQENGVREEDAIEPPVE